MRQAREGCPHGLHTHPLPAHDTPPPQLTLPLAVPPQLDADHAAQFRSAWATIHRRPTTLAEDFDRDDELRWLTFLPLPIPKQCGCKTTLETAALALKVGAARAWWNWAITQYPPDLSSLRAYFTWGWFIHDIKCAELGAPRIPLVRAARIHGAVSLFSEAEIAEDVERTGPVGVMLNADWGLGDAICLTASLRDIQAAYPGEFEFFMHTGYADVFRNIPGIKQIFECSQKGISEPLPEIRYRINGPHHGTIHLIDFLRQKLEAIINRPIPAGPQRGWLMLDDADRIEPPVSGKFWVLSCGHRLDITTKAWPTENWQHVVSSLPEVQFVRVGAAGKWDVQPPIAGVKANLIGKTTIRQLINLIAHPNCIGVLGGESSAIHIAAAFGKRMVCVAGDRMLKAAVCYEGEDYLGDNGFACTGCVKYRVQPLELPGIGDGWPTHNKSLCILPTEEGYASCMTRVASDDVVRAICKMGKVVIDPSGIEIVEPVARDGNVSELELRILAKLAQGRKSLLEIGTFDGRTALNLAIHCATDGRVWTLDLPAGQTPVHRPLPEDLAYIRADKAPRWLNYPEASRKITALSGDSATYDFGSLKFDFIFVDGCHAADCVRSDTGRAMSMLLPGGVCLWHDYGIFPEVTATLNEIAQTLPLHRITGTSLVIYNRPDSPPRWPAVPSP